MYGSGELAVQIHGRRLWARLDEVSRRERVYGEVFRSVGEPGDVGLSLHTAGTPGLSRTLLTTSQSTCSELIAVGSRSPFLRFGETFRRAL